MRRMRICFRPTDVFFCFLFFVFFLVRQKIPDNRSRERLNGFSWNFYQTISGKCSFQRRTEMGLSLTNNFWGLKTTHCALGSDAWRMNQKNYFMLVCSWLRHYAATAVALEMHEGVNAFNLVLVWSDPLLYPGTSSTFAIHALVIHSYHMSKPISKVFWLSMLSMLYCPVLRVGYSCIAYNSQY